MQAGPPSRSTIGGRPRPVPVRAGFPTMAIMMMLPLVAGTLASIVNSWTGFIEAAFMDMTLTLETFGYGFGPAHCGAWVECGNPTFESYRRSRDLAAVLFVLALVAVAVKDMIRGGLGGEIDMGSADTKTLPEMLKYSVLVFALLFIFPPVWDVAAGAMNNVGVWMLNPMYDLAGRGEYVHGAAGRGEMCAGGMSHGDLAALAPYVRDWDSWAAYLNGDTGPMKDGRPSRHSDADNYIVPPGGTLTRECLHDMDHASCPWGGATPKPSAPPNYQIGDVLCSPDFKVKYVFRQALGVTELEAVNPEEILGAVTGTGGDDVLVAILTQFIKSSVTLQVVMVVFMTGVMVDVVTAFALSILPIVFFYKFLPMSDRVRLGDYGGAAFALLSMPLVASLVLTAGAGAVVTMAADGMEFGSFFTWLSALSVVLLVIGIPATMVPLIGAAQQQATAAIQTGVQTAQFAVTAAAAAAGGAVQGRRANMEFGKLSAMDPGMMTPSQQERLAQLEEAGHGRMSSARAALMGGAGGLRGHVFDQDGSPTQQFRDAAMPGTGTLTAASVQGLGGFSMPYSTESVAGLAGTLARLASRPLGRSCPRPRRQGPRPCRSRWRRRPDCRPRGWQRARRPIWWPPGAGCMPRHRAPRPSMRTWWKGGWRQRRPGCPRPSRTTGPRWTASIPKQAAPRPPWRCSRPWLSTRRSGWSGRRSAAQSAGRWAGPYWGAAGGPAAGGRRTEPGGGEPEQHAARGAGRGVRQMQQEGPR